MSATISPVTAEELAEALWSLLDESEVGEPGSPLQSAYLRAERVLQRHEAQQSARRTLAPGYRVLVPTRNVAVAGTGDYEECCIVCGEPTEGGHSPDRCIENISAGERQAFDMERDAAKLDEVEQAAINAVNAYTGCGDGAYDAYSLLDAVFALRNALKKRGAL